MGITQVRVPLLFALALAVFCCPTHGRATEPLEIGVSLGLTGQYSQPALMHKRAYELWQDEVNARGGILGRPVRFDIRDDKSDPVEAQRIYREFTADGGSELILAPYSSQLTAAVAPVAEEHGFPMLAAGAAADSLWRLGYQNLIGVLTPASRYTVGILKLAKNAHLSNIAVVHANDEFSREIAAGTRKWAPFLKLKIALDVEVQKSATDYLAIARDAREARIDLLIVAGYLDEAIQMRKAVKQIDWSPPAFFATVGPSLPEWKSILGKDADYALSTSIWEAVGASTHSPSHQFAETFQRRYGVNASYHAAAAYAACQVLEAAIASARSIEHDRLRDALFGMDVYTVLGRFSVDSTGMQVKRLDMVIQWLDGQKQIVWPEESHTAEPVFNVAAP
jgi:branched-chain amino acid transport system substrate-binding protein